MRCAPLDVSVKASEVALSYSRRSDHSQSHKVSKDTYLVERRCAACFISLGCASDNGSEAAKLGLGIAPNVGTGYASELGPE